LLQKDVGELPWVRPARLLEQVRQIMRVFWEKGSPAADGP
jgi:hypothetical protein